MKEITLPSGVLLRISLAPFDEAERLRETAFEEMKTIDLNPDKEMDANFYKNLFCTAFSSNKFKEALKPCMARALYGDNKCHLSSTWESPEAREDYMAVLSEVAKENLTPFLKGLTSSLKALSQVIQGAQT